MDKTFRIFFVAVGLLLTVASARPTFAQQPLPPNLEPLPAYDLALRPDFLGGTDLVFSVLILNSGLAALEMNGGDITEEGAQEIFQRLYWDDGSFEDFLAGTYLFHDEHGHIHVEDYSEYILEEEAAGQSMRRGHKTSFCLLDTDKVDRHLPGFPKRAVYKSCGAKQGISVGWGDEYHFNLPGQSIDVTGLETGNYLLTIVSDPTNQIFETNEFDNSVTIRIHLDMEAMTVNGIPGDGGPGDPPGDVTVDGIIPATMPAGSVRAVTITGSGFTDGMNVALTNGSGPTPRVSNIVVQDENTITATITAKSGGPPRARIWDLMVGPATLAGTFTVFP